MDPGTCGKLFFIGIVIFLLLKNRVFFSSSESLAEDSEECYTIFNFPSVSLNFSHHPASILEERSLSQAIRSHNV